VSRRPNWQMYHPALGRSVGSGCIKGSAARQCEGQRRQWVPPGQPRGIDSRATGIGPKWQINPSWCHGPS
jgi:hypothetical protein